MSQAHVNTSAGPTGLALPRASSAPGQAGRGRIGIAVIVLLTLAYYGWTTTCSFDEPLEIRGKKHRETDHYNLLSRGFLSGHLHLDGEVPAALLTAPNPYDPLSRGPVEVLHDASYFRGRYYIYFGPAPVVTLFLPFTVLTGRDLPIPFGVLFFSSGCYLALVGIFLLVQRRHFPHASSWTIAAGLIAISGGTMLVALLRRPHIWELAGASGLAYFSASLLCLVQALHSRHAARWAALGGLALGLAVASRPIYIVCSVLFALPLLFGRWPASPGGRYGWTSLFSAAGTCSAIVLGLLAYNYARFEDPFEFGQKYQLSAIIEGDARHFSFSYIPFNFHVYFLSALRWIGTFPFHNGIVVPPSPPGHGGYEYSIGLFTNLPFSLFSLVAFASAAAVRARDNRDRARQMVLVVVGGAAVLLSVLLLSYFGSCIRYMADFTPWFMLLAAFGVFILEAHLGSRFGRLLLRCAALALAAFSAAASALAVVNAYDTIPGIPPAAYRPIARVTNYPAFRWRELQWPAYRPLEIGLTFPADFTARQEPLVSVVREGQLHAGLFVDYVAHRQVRFGYREAGDRPAHYSPTVAVAADARHTVKVSLGTDYGAYDGHRFRLRVQLDAWPIWNVPVISPDAFPGELEVGTAGAAGLRFTGTLHHSRPIRDRDFAPPRLGGARLRVRLTPEMAGRSFPLMSSGRTGAGDLLFLRVGENGRVVLGYDHWAAPLRLSPEIPMTPGAEHTLEFWVPAVNPRPEGAKLGEIMVKLDGAVAWQAAAPYFPAPPDRVFVGLNPIGGSTCETVLPNGVIEDMQVPPPSGAP